MDKITYLFGAGASKNALPIVEEMPNKIERLISKLNPLVNINPHLQVQNQQMSLDINNKKYLKEIIESLEWMKSESNNHASVDTLAKKLYLRGEHDNLRKLKIAMSVFFVLEQAINKPDIRYDAFYASILDDLTNLPNYIRILSWNYDYQFERSFAEYVDDSSLPLLQNYLNVSRKMSEENKNVEGFGIVKLNGTAGFAWNHNRKLIPYISNVKNSFIGDIKRIENSRIINEVIQNYVYNTSNPEISPSISFAWEDDKTIVEKAKKSTQDTTVLVVIGYSFPFFNREIDREIIQNMKQLKKVYFQAPDASDLKERFQAIRDDLPNEQLVTRVDVKQFLLPNEL